MGDYYRSKSYGDGRMEMESYHHQSQYGNGNGNGTGTGWEKHNYNSNVSGTNSSNGVGFQELRCYSASYANNEQQTTTQIEIPKELKKGKSANASSSSNKANWCFSDPELQRKKRVASYKSYSVEGKIKRSFSKSFRWLKHRFTTSML